MTISSTTRVAGPFIGNGTASTFAFTFKVFTAADLFVQRVTVADGTTTTLALTTDYTVSLNGNQNTNPGGSITLVAGALAAGYTLTITSDIDNVQPTDLTNQGGFYPEVITDSLDRATIQIQQVAATANNAVHAPVSDGALDMQLPVKELRTGKFLSFSAAGLPIVSDGTVTPDVTSGGNVTITANDAGANVDRDVVFVDNTTERMRLKGATGRLGIGTATPTVALDVIGSANVSSTMTAATASVTGTLTAATANVTGNLTVDTDTLFVNATGNAVGIGTTSPQSKLGIHSASTTTAGIRLTNVTTGNPASAAGLDITQFNNSASITNQQNGDLVINTNGAVGGIPGMSFKPSGYFGFASPNPAGAFHVTTGATGAYFSRVADDNGASNSTLLIATPNASAARVYGYGGLQWFTGAIGGAASARVTIADTGTVLVANLAGSGNRAVYSDSTGILTNTSSDASLKTNVQTMTDGEAIVSALRPVRYNWIDSDKMGLQREVGLIAQEVELVLPEVVGTNFDGTKSVDYAHLCAVLVSAIKSLQERVATLEATS